MEIELTVPSAMRQRHEPALLVRRPAPLQGGLRQDRSRQRLLVGLVAGAAVLGLVLWWAQLSFEQLIAAEIGAVGMLVFLLLVMRPFWAKWYLREAAAAPINRGAMRLRLDAEGVHAENDVLRQRVRWPGVLGVTQSATATGIWFGRGTLVVLPDEALPEGLDRSAMMTQIETWRAEA